MGKSLIIKGADFSKNGIVPDFIQLDWIAGTDTDDRYIASNISLVDGMKQEMEVTAAALVTPVIATHQSYTPTSANNTNSKFNAWIAGTFVDIAYGATSHRYSTPIIGDGKKHKLYWSKTTVKFDEEESTIDGEITYAGTRPLGLDSYYDGVTNKWKACTSNTTQIRIHMVKVWGPNDVLLMDAIPVKRTADNVVCFYDLVQDMYFERNDGSTPTYGELS